MKLRKFMSAVVSVATVCSMLASFATSASAATAETTSSKPTITGKATKVTNAGKVTISFSINSNAGYTTGWSTEDEEYANETGSGYASMQVNLTIDKEVTDELFSAISAAKIKGEGFKVDSDDDSKYVYTLNKSDLADFAVDGDELFKLTCTLKDKSLTLADIQQYKIVKSYDNLIATVKTYETSGSDVGELLQETKYRTDGKGNFADITGVYEYTAPVVKNEITGITFNSASSLPTTLADGDSFDFAATVAYTGTVDTTVKYTASVNGAEATEMESSTYTATATTAEQTVKVTATANGDTTKSVSHTFTIPAKKAQGVVWEKSADVEGGKKIHTWKATVGTDATFITVKKDTESRNINGIAEDGFALEDGAFRVFGIAIVTSADQDAFEFTINK